MPLRDYYDREELDELVRPSILQAWVITLLGRLNRELPRTDYRADADVQSEIGVLEELLERSGPPHDETIPAVLPDRCHVTVCSPSNTIQPVGIIAFATPRLKADGRKRTAFVHRCLGLLSNAAGLVVIDPYPSTDPSPCVELTTALGLTCRIPPAGAISFRTTARRDRTDLGTWVREFAPGQPFPAIPFGLRGGPTVVLDLEGTYTAAIDATGL